MAFSLGEYQDIFLEEADEQLQELNQNLLQLEKNPEGIDIINNIFRTAHSLKSSAAFVGLNDLSDMAHKMESLLQGIRDKTMEVSPEIVDLLFNCFDVISTVINKVASGQEPDVDLTEIIKRIQEMSDKKTGAVKAEPVQKEKEPAAAPPAAESAKISLTPEQMKKIKEGLGKGMSCCEISVFIDINAHMRSIKAQLILANLQRIGTVVLSDPPMDSIDDASIKDGVKVTLLTGNSIEDVKKACDIDQIVRVDLRKISITKKDEKILLKFHEKETLFEEEKENVPSASKLQAAPVKEKEIAEDEEEEEYKIETIKVHDEKRVPSLKIVKVSVDKLDQLLNNVGELVIANSGFYKLYDELRRVSNNKTIINEFKNRMDQMSRIAKDLQGGIMKTRMVPIGQVFSRFNRLVRDLAKEFGKKVRLEIKGEDTELDKKVIDAIGEPLMHLIRNAIDHGIENSQERNKITKPEIAVLTLNAFQSGNQICVQVSDDGRGLNIVKIKKKALEKGLATAEMLAGMDNDEIYNFIYAPGFSTTDIVTDISGRGVGMNVVKEIVSELNGNVSIETETGMGTRFTLSFPLTLAIIPAIMVKVSKELYAIPLSDVIETIKISIPDITTIEGHEVINLRGEILSLLRLNEFVGVKSSLDANKKLPVVVVGYGNRKIGLIVDELEGKQEIVIKSLEQNYVTIEGLAGASILGDGSICLILDIASMINKVIYEQDKLAKMKKEKVILPGEAKIESIKTADMEPISRKEVKAVPSVEKKDKITAPKEEAAPKKEVPSSASIDIIRPPEEEFKAEIKEDIIFDKTITEKQDVVQKPAGPVAKKTADQGENIVSKKVSDLKEGIDENIEKRVQQALDTFRDELRENVKANVENAGVDDHIKQRLDVTEEDVQRVQVLANIGIANAAESLSKILNKQIDLSIPEVSIMPLEKIPESIGLIDSIYLGVYVPLVGDIKGTILFILDEAAGFELIDVLYGSADGKTKELNEDGASAIEEVTNIIGASVINIFSEKTGLALKPNVPTIVHDYMQSILDSILVLHNISNDYALVMDTVFYYQNDKIIGSLLILPDTGSLKKIVERLR